MLLLLDVYGLRCVTNYILLLIVKSPNTGYIVLYNMYMTISVSIGLYPKLDSWNANELQLHLHLCEPCLRSVLEINWILLLLTVYLFIYYMCHQLFGIIFN
jgi:hypothetical protein